MKLILVGVGIYFIGCGLALLLFLLGGSRRLNTRNWLWPVVFLWPVLTLWPVYAITEAFLKWKTRRQL